MDSEFDYLVQAANEVSRLAVLPAHPTPEEYGRAAGIACKAFNRLYNDQQFTGVLKTMSLRVRATNATFNEITGSLQHFKVFFVPRDIELLANHGVEADLLRILADRAEELLVSIREHRVDEGRIGVQLLFLRDDACELSAQLRRSKERQDSRRRLRRYAFALGGTTIIVVNASSSALNYLSLAGTAVSAAWGTALIAPLIT